MSLINEYRATEEAIKELQERLKSLEQDDKLKKELEFEEKLRTLMGTYQKSLRDVISLLDPDAKIGKSNPHCQGACRQARAQGQAVQEPAHRRSHRDQGRQPQDFERVESQVGPEAVESWATLLG